MDWSEEALSAYLGGFLDSDGTVGLARNGKASTTVRLRICIFNNNPTPLEFLQDHFGGTIHSRKPGKGRLAKRVQYTLVWQAKTGYEVLAKAAPYMIAKREQAYLAIAFYERNLQDGFSRHVDKEWQEQFYFDMKALNLRFRKDFT